MTTKEIADRLVELCRKGEWEKAQEELYHPSIVSHEPKETGGQVTEGIDEIYKKNEHWASLVDEVFSWNISDPLIADGYFACTMTNDVMVKGLGRMMSTEICVYEVVDGKIVSERFFHGPSTPS